MVLVEGTIAENTPGRGWGCPGEDHEMSPLADTRKPSSEMVSDDDSRSPCGGPLPLLPGGGGSFRWISVVPVDGTIAEDTPGRECPRDDRDW